MHADNLRAVQIAMLASSHFTAILPAHKLRVMEALSVRSTMLKTKNKFYLLAAPFLLVLCYLFYKYVPWLVARKPIEVIDRYNLENIPPPEGAVYFAINHGNAIYYYEKTQLELYFAALAFIVSGFAIAILLGKAHSKNT